MKYIEIIKELEEQEEELVDLYDTLNKRIDVLTQRVVNLIKELEKHPDPDFLKSLSVDEFFAYCKTNKLDPDEIQKWLLTLE